MIAEGERPQVAREAARRSFGSVVVSQERFHESARWMLAGQSLQDLRYVWRGLWRSGAFAVTTILTLATALGLVTAVFAVFNAYVLRPFAVREPASLHQIAWRSETAGGATFSWDSYLELTSRRDLFDAAIADATRVVASREQQLAVSYVSGNYFDVLGPRVVLGRGLASFDARVPGGEPVES